MREVKRKLGRPDNSMFIRRCIFYGIILAVMLIAAPLIFKAIMVSMAADGITGAWYKVFVPITLFMMIIGLFRSWRRRWPLAYIDWYKKEAEACDYETCPRCGSPMVLKRRTRNRREKVGEEITTTTYSDGSKTVDSKDIYGNVKHTSYYHECTNSRCQIEAEQHISQSHLPWKIKQIRCLVLNDDRALNRKNTCAKHFLLSRLLVPFIALVIVAVCAFTVYSYADSMSNAWTYTTADKESSRSVGDYENYLLSLDTENSHWSMHYEKTPSDMMNYLEDKLLKQNISSGYGIQCYGEGDKKALIYDFDGVDAGTGLPDGEYILTKVDGVNVLIDDENKKIYKQGTEFYDTYVPKLSALTHDDELKSLFDKVDGGEHALSGSNDFWMEFVRKDNTMIYSYMLSDDVTKISGGDLRAVTTYPDELVTEQWFFSYGNDDYVYEPDLEGFVYSDAMPTEINDELGKLIAESSDGTGTYELYRNDEVVMDISVTTYPSGYEFEFSEAENGFEEDTVYRVNVSEKTLTKVTEDENYQKSETDMPLSEHQDKYDFLLSIVPESCIRSLIDMDKAEIKKENAGLVKNYIMKDGDGKITAEMKVMFGKIAEVNQYISDNEYAKIELDY